MTTPPGPERVIVAFGITAPDSSATCPVNAPVCANRNGFKKKNNDSKQKNLVLARITHTMINAVPEDVLKDPIYQLSLPPITMIRLLLLLFPPVKRPKVAESMLTSIVALVKS